MSGRFKIVISVVVAVLVLTIGSGIAAVYADESTTETKAGVKNEFLARVAQILGIPVGKLENAMNQAREDLKLEEFFKLVDKAAEKGIITQDEAKQVKDWWKGRPEALARVMPKGLGLLQLVGPGKPPVVAMPKKWQKEKREEIKERWEKKHGENKSVVVDILSRLVDKAVEKGIITPEEGKQIKDWWKSRPEALNKLWLPMPRLTNTETQPAQSPIISGQIV